jgi:sugar lactone lactonase YvrE
MKPELLFDAKATLGEGPAWDARTDTLYWLDIKQHEVHIFDPNTKSDKAINVGEPVGCAAPMKDGRLIMGLKTGLATLNLESGSLLPGQRQAAGLHDINFFARPEAHLPGNRFNDGKCDPAGRFLAGTMDDAEVEASGALYSIGHDYKISTLISGVRISNGLAWSPDYKTLYYIDTPTRNVMAYDYHLDDGSIHRPRVAVTIPAGLGWPDGMTSDAEGNLWVALWGGAAVTCWNPATGSLIRKVDIPALNVTSCVFGGEGLRTLYLTSARINMSAEQLEKYPLTGGVFKIETQTQGMPTYLFG